MGCGKAFVMILLVLLCSKEGQFCSIGICFTWKVTNTTLTLTCKVSDLRHRIFIRNQFNKTIADCLPPVHYTTCDPYRHNATISQNIWRHETIYTEKGEINSHLNGNWTCKHATAQDTAMVEVTVLKEPAYTDNSNLKQGHNEISTQSSGYANKSEQGLGGDTSREICALRCLVTGIGTFTLVLVCCYLLSSVITRLLGKYIDGCFEVGQYNNQKCVSYCKKIAVFGFFAFVCVSAGLCSLLKECKSSFYWFILVGIVFGLLSGLIVISKDGANSRRNESDNQLSAANSEQGRDSIHELANSEQGRDSIHELANSEQGRDSIHELANSEQGRDSIHELGTRLLDDERR